jgi:hypothetical protein
VLDVHSPHSPMIGWRDFLLHLITITIGLLIALSLEGVVEWQHHRHLVREAEASLHSEIQNNAKGLPAAIDDLRKQQADLKQDVTVLKYVIVNKKLPKHSSMTVTFHIKTFEAVSWKTAQTTGAFSYMPYDRAQEFSDIYTVQDMLAASEAQAARDALVSLGTFLNFSDGDPDPTPAEAHAIKDKIEVLQGQLLLVDSLMQSLSGEYKRFLDAHPQ